MLSPAQLQARILAGGDTPARRAIFAQHFAQGAPRKLLAAQARLPLARLRVLEPGCGWGVYLAQHGPGSVGLDCDAERVAFARSLGLDARVCDLAAPGWTRGLADFEALFVCDLLAHLAEPERFLAEARATLAPGGRMLLSEWVFPSSPLAFALARRTPQARQVLHAPEHLQRFSREGVEQLLARSGWACESSYLHTFSFPGASALLGWFWPPRSWIARRSA